jgi:hypothetical protein
MLPPFSVAFVKGWRRSLAMLIICEGIRSIGIDLADVDSVFKEICGYFSHFIWIVILLSLKVFFALKVCQMMLNHGVSWSVL